MTPTAKRKEQVSGRTYFINMRKKVYLCVLLLLTQVGAAPASTLATSASGRWQLSRAEAGAVTLTPLPDSHARKAPPQTIFSNPRYTFWADEYQTWEASRAAFSPRSQYAIVQWSDPVPKYTSSELDVITLDGYQRQTLPMSDLRNSLAMPIWSSDEKYLAAPGGNSVRLWTLGNPRFNVPITVRLLARPAAKGLDVGFAQVLAKTGGSLRCLTGFISPAATLTLKGNCGPSTAFLTASC